MPTRGLIALESGTKKLNENLMIVTFSVMTNLFVIVLKLLS